MSGCLSVCLYPINVKTAKPIGPKFFCGISYDTGEGYEWSKCKNLCLKVFYLGKFWKFAKNYYEICKLVLFCFILFKVKMLTNKNRRWARSALKASILILFYLVVYLRGGDNNFTSFNSFNLLEIPQFIPIRVKPKEKGIDFVYILMLYIRT